MPGKSEPRGQEPRTTPVAALFGTAALQRFLIPLRCDASVFKKIKAQKKSKYIKGSPLRPYCHSTHILRGLGNSQELSASPQGTVSCLSAVKRNSHSQETQNALMLTTEMNLPPPGGKHMVLVSQTILNYQDWLLIFLVLRTKLRTSLAMQELWH